jgi:hypothetical protein
LTRAARHLIFVNLQLAAPGKDRSYLQREICMPQHEVVVTVFVTSVFALFGLVLAYANWQANRRG